MASRVGVAQVGKVDYKDWLKTDVSKPSKKGLGGRTPLGDLSNALKNSSSLNNTSKKQQQQTGSGVTGLNGKKKSSAFAGGANAASGKTSVKASGNRKVLSDISNSSNEPKKSDISQKAVAKNSKRLSVVQEEDHPMHPCAIAEEGFLHNHDECIKAKNRQMDLDEFLKILGLDKDCSDHFENQRANHVEPDSPKRHYQLTEEEESWDFGFPTTMHNLHSPSCSSPPSPKFDSSWLDNDFIDFQLIASP